MCPLPSGHTQRIQRLICTNQLIFSSSTDKTCMLWRMKEREGGKKPEEWTDPDEPDKNWIRTFRVRAS